MTCVKQHGILVTRVKQHGSMLAGSSDTHPLQQQEPPAWVCDADPAEWHRACLADDGLHQISWKGAAEIGCPAAGSCLQHTVGIRYFTLWDSTTSTFSVYKKPLHLIALVAYTQQHWIIKQRQQQVV